MEVNRYNIVIADDEENIRTLLAKNINKSDTEFKVVGTAQDGAEALKLVKELTPSIVITDICMPAMNGLDLIRSIKELDQNIKTVIISGYDEFAYAKTAMKLGVTEYLLKPFLPEELFEVLFKIREELSNQVALKKNLEDMQSQIEADLRYSQERYIKKLVSEQVNKEWAMVEGERVKFDLSANLYCVGIFKLKKGLSNQDSDLCSERTVTDLLDIIKNNYFESDLRTYAANLSENQLVMIFSSNCKSQLVFYKNIRTGMEKINQSLERYYEIKLRGAIGNIYTEFYDIYDSYHEASAVWRGLLYLEETIVMYEEYQKNKEPIVPDVMQKAKENEMNLLLHIQMSREKEALEALNDVLQFYTSFSAEYAEFINISLVELVFNISDSLMKAGGNLRVWEDESIIEYLRKHFTHGSLMEAKVVLEDYVLRCCKEFSAINEKQSEKIVYNIKMLIENNLHDEEFNLEVAATKLFFSHNYVRQIFKQKTGVSFADYLIQRRMETAAELLKDSTLKIHEVAQKTGYSNQRYFASSFKKFYDCTPSEFRGKD